MLISVIFSAKLPGYGFIGGQPPPEPNPDGYDGRAKVMNVPSAMRITVHDASAPLAPVLRQAWSRTDGTWHIGALPTETRLLVMFWNDGQYTQLVGGEVLPVNSFVQDHVYATRHPLVQTKRIRILVGLPVMVPVIVLYGDAPLMWSVTGALPSGVSFSGGVFSASWPTGATGAYPVSVEVEDASGQVAVETVVLDLVLLPLKIVSHAPEFVLGESVSHVFAAYGGEGPYEFAVTDGALPSGVTLDKDSGALSGAPDSAGDYDFIVSATDARGAAATQHVSGSVALPSSPRKMWRILVSDNNGYGYVNLVELQFDSSQATGGTPLYSSQYDATWSAAAAFDGVTTGDVGWSSVLNDIAGSYIGYEFSTARTVDSITIIARTSAGGLTGMPRDFDVQSSDDGIVWTTEWSVTGQTGWTANQHRTFNRP